MTDPKLSPVKGRGQPQKRRRLRSTRRPQRDSVQPLLMNKVRF